MLHFLILNRYMKHESHTNESKISFPLIRESFLIHFKLPIVATAPAASKNTTCFKSGQKKLENNHLTSKVKVRQNMKIIFLTLKLRCDTRFQRAFTACICVFKVITLA